MKLKKIALMATSMALVAALAVGGTLAYLTSTDSVKNTFTVGQVKITLDEAKVNDEGKAVNKEGTVVTDLSSAERVDNNSYKLMPGHEYTKDPTVTVLANSEESYVRLVVTVNFEKTLNSDQLATDLDTIFKDTSAKWVRNSKQVKNNVTVGEGNDAKNYGTVITYEYRYVDDENAIVSATAADTKLDPLFKGIEIPKNWDGKTLEDIGKFDINIVAQAIQADGFNDAAAAWAAYSE